MIDSPNLPENETVFNVTDAGVVDEAWLKEDRINIG
jgi:hypothetical protein